MVEFTKIVILLIVTSQSQMGPGGEPTGVWLEEVTTPYYAFVDAGYEVVVASPQGGAMPIDPRSLEERGMAESVKRYQQDEAAQALFGATYSLDALPADTTYVALFLPGGHGPMWDLASSQELGELVKTLYLYGKPIGAVCHGPAGLLPAKNDKGGWLFSGVELTAFSNAEESAVGLETTVPFLLENRLVQSGAVYSRVKNFEPHIVIDNNLITGQNPASASLVAEAMLEQIKEFKEKQGHKL